MIWFDVYKTCTHSTNNKIWKYLGCLCAEISAYQGDKSCPIVPLYSLGCLLSICFLILGTCQVQAILRLLLWCFRPEICITTIPGAGPEFICSAAPGGFLIQQVSWEQGQLSLFWVCTAPDTSGSQSLGEGLPGAINVRRTAKTGALQEVPSPFNFPEA